MSTDIPKTSAQIQQAIRTLLQRLLPGADLSALAATANLREQLAADSMDVLNFVVALGETFGVNIPESDYGRLDTLAHCVDYLQTHRREHER